MLWDFNMWKSWYVAYGWSVEAQVAYHIPLWAAMLAAVLDRTCANLDQSQHNTLDRHSTTARFAQPLREQMTRQQSGFHRDNVMFYCSQPPPAVILEFILWAHWLDIWSIKRVVSSWLPFITDRHTRLLICKTKPSILCWMYFMLTASLKQREPSTLCFLYVINVEVRTNYAVTKHKTQWYQSQTTVTWNKGLLIWERTIGIAAFITVKLWTGINYLQRIGL